MQIMSWKRVTLYLQHNYDYGWFCSLFCSCVNEWSIMCFLFYPLWPGSERALGPFLWEGKPNELSKPNTTTDHVNVVCSGTFGERKKIKPDINLTLVSSGKDSVFISFSVIFREFLSFWVFIISFWVCHHLFISYFFVSYFLSVSEFFYQFLSYFSGPWCSHQHLGDDDGWHLPPGGAGRNKRWVGDPRSWSRSFGWGKSMV